jgi:predicted enzyme related to lactoylglutathione lyase
MKKLSLSLIGILLVAHQMAYADVTFNSVRVGAQDTPALAAFYSAAFGMHEFNRLALQSGPEIFLNFGASADAARANPGAPIVIMPRMSDALEDPIPHIIFNVTDIAATVAALKAAGGTMQREAFAFGNSGMMIGIAADPAGNLIELIQPAR